MKFLKVKNEVSMYKEEVEDTLGAGTCGLEWGSGFWGEDYILPTLQEQNLEEYKYGG